MKERTKYIKKERNHIKKERHIERNKERKHERKKGRTTEIKTYIINTYIQRGRQTNKNRNTTKKGIHQTKETNE